MSLGNVKRKEEILVGTGSNCRDRSNETLTARVVKSILWGVGGKFSTRVLFTIRMIVLARLLSPRDFGLFGIVMLAIACIGRFTETGVVPALVQKKGDSEKYFDTAWSIQLIRSAILALFLFLLAPLVAIFFREPRACNLLRAMCVVVALQGLVNIGTVRFEKELLYRKRTIYSLIPVLASLVVSVGLAIGWQTVWVLIWGEITSGVVTLALSYAMDPYRPKWNLNRQYAKELLHFGKWMFGSSIIVFLATNIDDAVLGRLMGAAALGIYQIAFRIANAPVTEFTHVIGSVMFPAYAKVQEEKELLARGFLDVLEFVFAIAFPIGVFMIVASSEIVVCILGDQWTAAIAPLKWLVAGAVMRTVLATGGVLFIGAGKPRFDVVVNLIRLVMLSIVIVPMTWRWGIVGTCAAVVVSILAMFPWWWRSLKSIVNLSWKEFGGRLLSGLILGAVVLVACYLPTKFVSLPVFWRFGAQMTMGAVAYLTVGVLLFVFFKMGPGKHATRVFKVLRG